MRVIGFRVLGFGFRGRVPKRVRAYTAYAWAFKGFL